MQIQLSCRPLKTSSSIIHAPQLSKSSYESPGPCTKRSRWFSPPDHPVNYVLLSSLFTDQETEAF